MGKKHKTGASPDASPNAIPTPQADGVCPPQFEERCAWIPWLWYQMLKGLGTAVQQKMSEMLELLWEHGADYTTFFLRERNSIPNKLLWLSEISKLEQQERCYQYFFTSQLPQIQWWDQGVPQPPVEEWPANLQERWVGRKEELDQKFRRLFARYYEDMQIKRTKTEWVQRYITCAVREIHKRVPGLGPLPSEEDIFLDRSTGMVKYHDKNIVVDDIERARELFISLPLPRACVGIICSILWEGWEGWTNVTTESRVLFLMDQWCGTNSKEPVCIQ
jgi:hypothetical protein